MVTRRQAFAGCTRCTVTALAALTATIGLAAGRVLAADLSPVIVRGRDLVANGKAVRLRGIDWGWWHLGGTRYTEDDMRRQAEWGANVARLVFSYNDLQNEDGSFKDDGFRKFDDVIQWGKKYGVYVILDMHVVPGGQSKAPYCAHGADLVWTDPGSQRRYLDLWKEIARRYHDRPEVAAYEMMNEPNSLSKSPDVMLGLYNRTIAAIREVDPAKVIVVMGDRGSGPDSMIDALKLPDKNLLYTFHFYTGSTEWTHNLKDGPGIKGTQDWTRIEEQFAPPADASEMSVMLRSTANSGESWFDDVRLVDDTAGKVLESHGFGANAEGYGTERGPVANLAYDPVVGHDKPGSLRVQHTTDYNGWAGPRIRIEPGHRYSLSGWVKLEQATGDTYLSMAFYKSYTDTTVLRKAMAVPIAFAKKYDVPVWIGEFGFEEWTPPAGIQQQWVKACIGLFEEAGFDWTYWNYRETTSPLSMALHAEHKDGTDYPINEPLLAALREGWKHNVNPGSTVVAKAP